MLTHAELRGALKNKKKVGGLLVRSWHLCCPSRTRHDLPPIERPRHTLSFPHHCHPQVVPGRHAKHHKQQPGVGSMLLGMLEGDK